MLGLKEKRLYLKYIFPLGFVLKVSIYFYNISNLKFSVVVRSNTISDLSTIVQK